MNKPHPSRKKHANQLALLRSGIRYLSVLSPRLAGRLADFLWYRTYRSKEPIREKAVLEQANWRLLELNGIPIQTYIWGEGDQSILLVHGWNGRGAQLGHIALSLSEQGFRVVAFDLPAHGRSAGKRTDLPTISATIQALEQHYGSFYAAVSHSFGGMCLLHAVSVASHVERLVTISTPLDVATLMNKFALSLQLSPRVFEIQKQLLEKRFGESVWHRFSIHSWIDNLAIPGLVIHDRCDEYVEAENSIQIGKAWPRSEVLFTENLGHHRILTAPVVIQRIIEFIQG